MAYPVDDEAYGDDDGQDDEDPTSAADRRSGRRPGRGRLASAPRAAK
jgi:hypothetical protein